MTPRKRTARLLTPLAAVALLLVPACRSVQSASFARSAAAYAGEVPDRPEAPAVQADPDVDGAEADSQGDASAPSSRWPSRWGQDPSVRGVIVELDPEQRLRPAHFSRYYEGRATPDDYDDAAKLAAALGVEQGFKFKAEGPGSFVFIPDTRDDEPLKDAPDLAFKFVSATPTRGRVSGMLEDEDHVALQRTWFTYRDPKAPRAGQNDAAAREDESEPGEPLGTIVLLPGMFGTPEPIVNACERYWHNRGYAVLRMLSHPSRFTQHARMIMISDRAQPVAAAVARTGDDRVAECAYATSAAMDHLLTKRPGLSGKPVVLVGMSGGAMALPTVYAYQPQRYDAAVLIAGGANFLRIMVESNYRDWIDAVLIDFDPGDPTSLGKPTREQVEALSERYLALSKLDAYHTATEMGSIPVLMLHATSDRAVPSSTGNTLYRRLSEPERWTYPMGHELIFATLPTQVPRIDRWLTEHVLDQEPDQEDDQQEDDAVPGG